MRRIPRRLCGNNSSIQRLYGGGGDTAELLGLSFAIDGIDECHLKKFFFFVSVPAKREDALFHNGPVDFPFVSMVTSFLFICFLSCEQSRRK